MVETFVISGEGARHVGSAADLAAASASLPAGAYTTLRTYGGDGIAYLADHVRRLEQSSALEGRPGHLETARVRGGLAEVLRLNAHPESRIRLTFAPPELFASSEPFAPLAETLYDEGVRCATVATRRDLPQAKGTRFLSSAQAAYAALPAGAHEGLLMAEDGALLEGLSSNLFAVLEGTLRTEDRRALHGTTRALVLELARGLVPVDLTAVTRSDLSRTSELFITSVSREVLPVVRVDEVTIGRGRPGPLARDLRRRYRGRVERDADHLLAG